MRQVSLLLFLQPAKVCILQSLSLLRRFILLPGLPEAPTVPGLFAAIGLDAAEELLAIGKEEQFSESRDLGTTLFFVPASSSPSFWCAHQAEIFGAAKRAEMADIEQMKKIVPFITCEIPLSQHVCELVPSVNVFDLVDESKCLDIPIWIFQ